MAIIRSCLKCKKEFIIPKSRIKRGRGKYCSQKCYWQFIDKGKTTVDKKIRQSVHFKQWAGAVKERDDFTCQICGIRGGRLESNHIKRFVDYIDLRFDLINLINGITLCEACHIGLVNNHEPEWESYFNFNLMTRGFLEDKHIEGVESNV